MVFCFFCPAFGVEKNAEVEHRLVERFAAMDYDKAAFSGDGEYLAYSKRVGDEMFVLVVHASDLGKLIGKIKVGSIESSQMVVLGLSSSDSGAISPTVLSLYWVGHRVVVTTNLSFLLATTTAAVYSLSGAIMSFDPDGGNAKILKTAREFRNFDDGIAWDGSQILIPPEQGESNYSAIDVRTGKVSGIALTTWRQAEESLKHDRRAGEIIYNSAKVKLAVLFRSQRIDALSVSAEKNLIAIRVHSTCDPGTFYVFSSKAGTLYKIGQYQPLLDPSRYVVARLKTQGGVIEHESLLIAPAEQEKRKWGVVVTAWATNDKNALLAYSRDSMAFVDMGYAVLQVEPGVVAGKAGAFVAHVRKALEKVLALDDPASFLPVVFVADRKSCDFLSDLPFIDQQLFSGMVFIDVPLRRESSKAKGKAFEQGQIRGAALCLFRESGRFARNANLVYAQNFGAKLEAGGMSVQYTPINGSLNRFTSSKAQVKLNLVMFDFLQGYLRKSTIKIGPLEIVDSELLLDEK